MSNDTLASKIELLQEQIHNLEKSGHFTEKEIDSQSYPLRQELDALKEQFFASRANEIAKICGLTADEMREGIIAFNELWSKIYEVENPIFEIEVIDAERLTPNHITA